MSNESESQITFERGAAILLGLVCAISLVALAGWLFNIPILASLRSEYIPMAPVSGLIFLGLSGAWFIHRRFSTRHGIRNLIRIGLAGVLIIVFILVIRYFTGVGPDLERLVYPEPALFGQFLTARMSPLSALGFSLAIPAILLMTGRNPVKGIRTTAASLSLVVFFLSIINILGYFYGAPLFYGGTLIPVAITTAFAFLFLSLGLLMTAGPSCWPVSVFIGSSLKARLMRNIIPASMVIVLIQGFLSSVNDPWSINPAVKVAVAALVAWLIVVVIISIIAKSLDAEIERGKQAEEGLRQSEAELRALFASMHDVVLVIDRDGVYRKIAPTNPELLVKPSKELLGKNLRDVFPSEQVETFLSVMQQVLDTKQTAHIEYDLNISKQTVRFETSISLMTEDSTLWVARDITERKRFELIQNAISRIAQAALTSEGIDPLFPSIHSILGELIPAENFYIALYDPASNLVSFPYYIDQYDEPPPAPTQIHGLTGYVLRTERPLLATREIFDSLVQQGEVEAVGTPSVDWMGAPLKVEGRLIGVMAVQSYTQGIHYDQEDLNLLEFVSTQVAQAIGRKRLEQEIRSLALTDELTGLYNRRGFTLLAEQEMKLSYRFKRSILLFFVDVDDLKTINDTLGHAHGDLALKEVAAILKEIFREADIPARFGGDEFVVLAPDSSMESADILTNRLQTSLEARNRQGKRPYHLTLSMGIARYDPEAPCTVTELIAQADDLMYRQKQARKGKL